MALRQPSDLCNQKVHHWLALLRGAGHSNQHALLDAIAAVLEGFGGKIPFFTVRSIKQSTSVGMSSQLCRGRLSSTKGQP